MGLIRLVLVNLKRQLKNPLSIGLSFIMPLVMIISINAGGFQPEVNSIGIIDKNKTNYSSELKSKLNKEYDTKDIEGNVEDSYNLLMQNKLGVIYVIDDDFGEKLERQEVPSVKCYKVENSTGTIMAENIINDYVSSNLKESISEGLSRNAIKTDIVEDYGNGKLNYKLSILLVCYCMIIGGSSISGEIIKMKNQKVLKRTIATSNSDMKIIGGIFISSFILQGVLCNLAFIIVSIVLKLEVEQILQGVILIFLGSLISTAIVTVITRWVKNEMMSGVCSASIGITAFGLSIFGEEINVFDNVPDVVSNLSVMSPFTWLLKIIDTGEFFVPILIIVLMSLVLFTAGSFKLREYVKCD